VRTAIETQYPAGETGFDAGAEGATAPETLRQKDRRITILWKAAGCVRAFRSPKEQASPAYFGASEISQVP
jgi:hypothetical protein